MWTGEALNNIFCDFDAVLLMLGNKLLYNLWTHIDGQPTMDLEELWSASTPF